MRDVREQYGVQWRAVTGPPQPSRAASETVVQTPSCGTAATKGRKPRGNEIPIRRSAKLWLNSSSNLPASHLAYCCARSPHRYHASSIGIHLPLSHFRGLILTESMLNEVGAVHVADAWCVGRLSTSRGPSHHPAPPRLCEPSQPGARCQREDQCQAS